MPEITHGPWTIDLEARLVTHQEGWQFQLWPSAEDQDAISCVCVEVPLGVAEGSKARLQTALTLEAGRAYIEALEAAER